MEKLVALKVLIVDDDPINTTMLSRILEEEQPGFEVHAVNSGLEGIEAVRTFKPDVIVLDLMMPGLSGWEVCQRIRNFSQVPILILSAVTDSQLVMQSLDHGADGYLVKPVPNNVLITHIRELAART